MKSTVSGCDTLKELWKVAVDCNIQYPGIGGVAGRAGGFVQCANIRDFMVIASLKCWEERPGASFPPVAVVDTNVTRVNVENKESGKQSKDRPN